MERVAAALSFLTGGPVDESAARLLHQGMEGWAIGLQLAAMTQGEDESFTLLAERMTTDRHTYVTDYLMALEVDRLGNLIRTYVDCGPGLMPLLQQIEGPAASAKHVARVLDAMTLHTVRQAQSRTGGPNEAKLMELRALLTNREQEVLLLMADRLSNKEIAAALVLSPLTVKKYTANIYRKLGVNNRREAVSMADHIGLLAVL